MPRLGKHTEAQSRCSRAHRPQTHELGGLPAVADSKRAPEGHQVGHRVSVRATGGEGANSGG